MTTQGATEFLRVFGHVAHVEPSDAGDTFVGWCDGWPDQAVYDADAAALILAHFEDEFGDSDDGDHVVCAALEASGALLRLRH